MSATLPLRPIEGVAQVFEVGAQVDRDNRQFARLEVRCRARIRIGNREYAGYIENISEGGARIVTLGPITDFGRGTAQAAGLSSAVGRTALEASPRRRN